MTTPIDKAEIRRLIPHAGTMCLLDSVLGWDDESIVCTTNTHRDEANPLRRDGRLSVSHSLEQGARCPPSHRGLRARAAGASAAPCFWGSLRCAHARRPRLDDLASPLEVRAQRLFGDSGNTIYQCAVSASGISVAEERVTIMLRP